MTGLFAFDVVSFAIASNAPAGIDVLFDGFPYRWMLVSRSLLSEPASTCSADPSAYATLNELLCRVLTRMGLMNMSPAIAARFIRPSLGSGDHTNGFADEKFLLSTGQNGAPLRHSTGWYVSEHGR